jgi:hypothetical protein
MKKVLLFITIVLLSIPAFSQVEKKVVAIMPFLSSSAENRNYAAQLQSIALQTFNSNSNATFIDRSADAAVLKELDNQIREQSISSKVLVEQVKLSGSNELIVGSLAGVSVESVQVSKLLGGGYDKKYSASISYSLQVIDGATGLTLSVKDFNGNTKKQDASNKIFGNKGVFGKATGLLLADTKDEAIRKAINATKDDITDWISESYPALIRIINIESRNKSGFPEVVLISGFGSDMSVGKKITIKEITMLDDGNGGQIRREKKIGELKVSEIQGQVTVCKVKDGETVLEEKMKNPASLKFIIE